MEQPWAPHGTLPGSVPGGKGEHGGAPTGGPGKAAASSTGLAERAPVGTWDPRLTWRTDPLGFTLMLQSWGCTTPTAALGAHPGSAAALGPWAQHRWGGSPTQSPGSRCCCRRRGESLPLICRWDGLPTSEALPPPPKPGLKNQETNQPHAPWPGAKSRGVSLQPQRPHPCCIQPEASYRHAN